MLGFIKKWFRWLSSWLIAAASLVILATPLPVSAYSVINDTSSADTSTAYDWLNRETSATNSESTTSVDGQSSQSAPNGTQQNSAQTSSTTVTKTSDRGNDVSTTPQYPNEYNSGYVKFANNYDLIGKLRASTPTPTLPDDNSYPYYIDRYDVDIKVGKDNIYHITEKIKAHFNESRHGIIRKIPTYNEVIRNDGSKSANRARISNIKLSDYYTTSGDGESQSIKIGDPDQTITGDKNYEISYDYDIGPDRLAKADEFYFNIIGDQWDTAIREVNFTVQMPDKFDASKLGFTSGAKYSTDSTNILYTIDGNKIYGINKQILGSNEALTMRLTLPDGYYQRQWSLGEWLVDNYWLVGMVMAGVLLLVTILIWLFHGRDGLVTKVISYGPPDGLDSLDTDLVYNGYPTNKGVISLLIYLANKGYLKIHIDKTPVKNYQIGPIKYNTGGDESYRIEKIKDYDGGVESERLFFDGLFKYGFNNVTEADLYNDFYQTVEAVKYHEKKSGFAQSLTGNSKKYQIIILAIAMATITLIPLSGLVVVASDFTVALSALMPSVILLAFYIAGGSLIIKSGQNKESMLSASGWWLFTAVFTIMFNSSLYFDSAGASAPLYVLMTAICALLSLIMMIFAAITAKRSEAGNLLLGQVRGLKDFLTTVEKDRIEAMVEDNPNFFYDILPFAYVLDVTDVWTKKFESMNLRAPDWYDSPDSTFSASSMSSFMGVTMAGITSSMVSRPSSSGGGGSSGGGSSGGGSGGGGGSSW